MQFQRGGRPDGEIRHGQRLLEADEGKIWGWCTPAGQARVRRRVAWLLQTCRIQPGTRVLECGCGTGIFTQLLAQSGATITALDISPDLLERARRRCTAANVTFLQGNLETPDVLANHSHDVLCGISVLHHLNVSQALKALRPKLAPGARFAFSEPNLLNPINKYYMFVPDMEKRRRRGVSPNEMAFRPSELRHLFETAGYMLEGLMLRDFMHPAIPPKLIPAFQYIQTIAENLPLIRYLSGSIWISGWVPEG